MVLYYKRVISMAYFLKKTTNKKNKPREKVNKKIEKELKPKNYRVRAILLFASGIVFLCLMFLLYRRMLY